MAGLSVPRLETRDVHRTFDHGRVKALAGVTLRIDAGESVAITGPSGSGKSTLLHLLGALETPTSGEVLHDGRSLTHGDRDLARYRAHTVGFVFQFFHLLPTLTACENVEMPMFETSRAPRARRDAAERLLARVGLAGRLRDRPAQLSGGERQRVAIARALANDPAVLLADEPTGNLDSRTADEVLHLIEEIRVERGMTLVVVTHSDAVAARAGRVVRLLDGRVDESRGTA